MREAARSTYRSIYYNKEGPAHMGIWKEPFEERLRINQRLKELSQVLLRLIEGPAGTYSSPMALRRAWAIGGTSAAAVFHTTSAFTPK